MNRKELDALEQYGHVPGHPAAIDVAGDCVFCGRDFSEDLNRGRIPVHPGQQCPSDDCPSHNEDKGMRQLTNKGEPIWYRRRTVATRNVLGKTAFVKGANHWWAGHYGKVIAQDGERLTLSGETFGTMTAILDRNEVIIHANRHAKTR